jgi:glutathione synthase/RimK-type ligase-like ATP-grasp enzyme
MTDTPMRRVRAAVDAAGADVFFVDQRTVLESGLELEIDGGVRGLLDVDGASVDLEQVSAVYVRPYDSARLPVIASAEPGSAVRRHAAWFDDSMWTWSDLTPARVVNRPSSTAFVNSKPRQGAIIAAQGFAVPETLVTTDAAAVRDFAAERGTLVYKSISGVRSIVSQLHADDERLADVAWCPTQFQECVPGDDYRVHVVGNEVFCSRVESPADDYRYGAMQGLPVTMTPYAMPDDWALKCRALTISMGLLLAGIDLRLTPSGDWYCFEVNSSPAFTFYDRHGQGIDRAVARLLLEAEVS